MRFLLLSLGLLGALWSAVMLISEIVLPSQLAKNIEVRADMRDRIAAVHSFIAREHRLPTEDEFTSISALLPTRYTNYQYEINAGFPDAPSPPKEGLDQHYWTLSFWRGEWAEHYSSWDDRDTLARQSSAITYYLPHICIPLATVGLLLAGRRPVSATA